MSGSHSHGGHTHRHAEAGLHHIASGDYVGEHWLASFAAYMLSTPAPD